MLFVHLIMCGVLVAEHAMSKKPQQAKGRSAPATELAKAGSYESCEAGTLGDATFSHPQTIAERVLAKDGNGCEPIAGDEITLRTGREFNASGFWHRARFFLCNGEDPSTIASLRTSSGKETFASLYAQSHVVIIEDFLPPDDISSLAALTRATAESEPPNAKDQINLMLAGAQYTGMSVKDPTLKMLPHHAALGRAEVAMASAVGIPINSREKPMQMLYGHPPRNAESLLDRGTFHQDKNNALARQVSILLYLSELEGGHTLFPAIAFKPRGAAPPARPLEGDEPARFAASQKFSQIVQEAVEERVHKSEDPGMFVEVNSALHFGLDSLCPGAPSGIYEKALADTGVVPFAVQPRPGRAVIFWQETLEGNGILHDVFHNGCDVRGGLKLALQKFKHWTRNDEGCRRSLWCSMSVGS